MITYKKEKSRKDKNLIRYVKMEKTELVDNQIFNIIEEIQDIIETTVNQAEPDSADTEILLPSQH